jgi:hypothetical protein
MSKTFNLLPLLPSRLRGGGPRRVMIVLAAVVIVLLLTIVPSLAHGVSARDQGFLASAEGQKLAPFVYLGAKHMVTGVDHLLYLLGVIFFLGKLRDVVLFASLFSLGHSITLLAGVLGQIQMNAYLIDAVIGLSVSYKAFENLGHVRGINPKLAVFAFGLIHGFGLSSKLQDLGLSRDGLVANMLAFNVGVEMGQAIALLALFAGLQWLRACRPFATISRAANWAIFTCGLVLIGMQATGYFIE